MSYNKAAGIYSDVDADVVGKTVFDVVVPVRLRSPITSEEFDAMLVLSFAWIAEAERWVPWRAGVYDPSASVSPLIAPWL